LVGLSNFQPQTFIFQSPGRILFGLDTVKKVGEEAKALGAGNVLIVAGEVTEKIGMVDRVKKLLEASGAKTAVFRCGKWEPYIEDFEAIVDFTRKGSYDVVLGLGGGKNIDMAKVAAIMPRNPGRVDDYIGVNKVKQRGIPMIIVPTTAGTGSEATQAAVIAKGKIKVAIWSPQLIPEVAIVDPNLTLTLPPKVTAATGADALTHALEAIMSVDANPMSDSLALTAIRLISRNLRQAYQKGDDVEARYNMCLASLMAGLAFNSAGLVAGHAAAYTYASDCKLPHGTSCGLAEPYIMSFNLPNCIEKFFSIAEAMDLKIEKLKPKEAAAEAVKAVKKIIGDVGLPTSLKELEVPKDLVPTLAEDLITKYGRLLPRNPRKITKEDALRIFEKMWSGELD